MEEEPGEDRGDHGLSVGQVGQRGGRRVDRAVVDECVGTEVVIGGAGDDDRLELQRLDRGVGGDVDHRERPGGANGDQVTLLDRADDPRAGEEADLDLERLERLLHSRSPKIP